MTTGIAAVALLCGAFGIALNQPLPFTHGSTVGDQARRTPSRSPCAAAIAAARASRSPLGCHDRRADQGSPGVGGTAQSDLTLAEVLRHIENTYPNYAVQAAGVVPVVHPRVLTDVEQRFLAQHVSPTTLGERTGLLEIFQFISSLFGRRAPDLPYVDTRPFVVRFNGGTVLDLLNVVARTHGELVWHLTDTPPGGSEGPLDQALYLQLLPVSGSGIGGVLPVPHKHSVDPR